jgi:hypothetical protein
MGDTLGDTSRTSVSHHPTSLQRFGAGGPRARPYLFRVQG